jgi:thermostable 8-oxoguanine DNA glycosylase
MEMTSPTDIIKFDRNKAELETFWMFCLFVAGKNSDYAMKCVNRMLLGNKQKGQTPFEMLTELHEQNPLGIYNTLVAHKVGQYGRLSRALEGSLSLDLANATLDELMGVFGVGPKTARFFLVYTRPDCRYAILDTHILRWMGKYLPNIPVSTPAPRLYEELEASFFVLKDIYLPHLSVARADLVIWAEMSGRDIS